MALSPAEIKRADIQSFRDVATALDGMATANNDMKTGVGRLPIAGDAWKGVSGDAAHHELDGFGKLLSGSAESKTAAAAQIRRAADEFEGVKQLLAKVEKDAANGKFTIDMATGKVTPPQGDYDKNELSYIQNTLRQLQQAGDAANADLAAAVKAAKEPPTGAGPSGALPAAPNSAVKPDGVFGGVQNLATANPGGEPGATKAAAAAGADTQANYKEWYPKTPGSGDKLAIDPSKAGSFTGTVGALEKLPGAPKPADGFGSGVARQFGQGVNSRVDGIIDEAKNLTGQGAPGSPGVAESWAKFALGTADQMANPLESLPGEVKDAVNDPAGFAGKKLFDVSSIAATGPLGGEATAGARGLLGDLTGAETRAITHGIDSPHTGPIADHGEGLGGEHSGGATPDFGGSDNLPHIEIKMKDGWSEFQQSQMELKMQQFNDAVGDNGFSQTPPVPRDPAVRQLFLDTLGIDRVPPGVHVDHTRDLQAGGLDSIDNMGLLDGSVNTSFGSQLNARMNEHPPGTVFGGVRPPEP
ncbi:endonuclease [Mycobacteroides abscessus]|uniref:endonuclease n=1 Tax=Mycobacteroides abscessus TaxID=36809 RepID=UPI003080CDF9